MLQHFSSDDVQTRLDGNVPLAKRLSQLPAFAFGVSGALASPLVNDKECETLIRQTLSAGGAIFDTGPSYGGGLGEVRLGRALAGNPDAFVMTKAGLMSSGLTRRWRDFTPDALKASVDASLDRLGREAIDLLWLHGPSREEITPDLIEALEQMKAAGRVRHFGIAGRTDDVLAALEYPILEAVMVPLNALPGHKGVAWAARAKSAGRVVFAIEAMRGVRPTVRRTRGQIWRAAQSMVRRVGPKNRPDASSPAEAFSWVYEHGGADVVVMTTTSQAHLEANVQLLAPRKLGSA